MVDNTNLHGSGFFVDVPDLIVASEIYLDDSRFFVSSAFFGSKALHFLSKPVQRADHRPVDEDDRADKYNNDQNNRCDGNGQEKGNSVLHHIFHIQITADCTYQLTFMIIYGSIGGTEPSPVSV